MKKQKLNGQQGIAAGLIILLVFITIFGLLAFIGFIGASQNAKNAVVANRTTTPKVVTQKVDTTCPAVRAEQKTVDLSKQSESYLEETTYFYFPVTGATKAVIQKDIERCNLDSEEDKEFHAITYWYVSYYWEPEAKAGACKVKWVSVFLDVDIYMPKLTSSNVSLQSEWDQYAPKLELHEEGHRSNSIGAAQDIQALLRGLSASDCASLTQEARRGVDSIVETYKAKDKEYDAQTDHGATQGAIF